LPFVGGVHIIHSGGMSGGLQNDAQRVEFALISADELYEVNRNEYTQTNWRDTVLWAWNVYARANEKQKLQAFILREWRQFPCAMTGVIWIQMKRKIKGIFRK